MAEWSVPGYTALKALGSGGFGDVMLARHDATGTLVAIKYLRGDLLADQRFADMFRAEATVLASLDDPNIVRLYEYVESPAGAAIVMELVEGVSLRAVLEQAGGTSAEAALVVLRGSLLGLSAAHQRGVVHRDYKPENVLINGEGASKLTDFGIAARSGENAIPAGTLLYAAPEQLAGAPASPASDVYAATATFYECLTGQPPFTGNAVQLLYRHSTEPVPLEPVPEPLRPLVASGMAKDPDGRPADAASFVTGLQAVAAATYGKDWADRGRSHLGEAALLLAALWPSGAPAPGQSVTVQRVSPRRVFRRITRMTRVKVAIAVGVVGVVAAGGVAVGLAHHSHRKQPPPPNTLAAPAGHIIFQTPPRTGPSACKKVTLRCFWNIHEIGPDGTGGGLLPIGNALCCGSPALSPDGSEVAAVGEGIVQVTDLAGNPPNDAWRRNPVVTPIGSFSEPAWSPSGKLLAFIASPGSGQSPQIEVINAAGTGKRVVIQGSEISGSGLAWSPDGTQLAFTTTARTIATVALSGGPVHTLVADVPAGLLLGLSWAPGPQPLFATSHGPGIWEANGRGGAKVVLKCSNCEYPSWAPDGIHFAAASPGRGVILATVKKGVQAVIGPKDVTYVQWGGPASSPRSSAPSPSPSPSASPSPGASLAQFKVCTSPAITCTSFGGVSRMKAEPAQIVTTADGSRYVKSLVWSGWGGTIAHGTGILEVDNCIPDCAQGTFTGYPATVTLSGLAGYGNGLHGYSVIAISAPGSPSPHEAFATGEVP